MICAEQEKNLKWKRKQKNQTTRPFPCPFPLTDHRSQEALFRETAACSLWRKKDKREEKHCTFPSRPASTTKRNRHLLGQPLGAHWPDLPLHAQPLSACARPVRNTSTADVPFLCVFLLFICVFRGQPSSRVSKAFGRPGVSSSFLSVLRPPPAETDAHGGLLDSRDSFHSGVAVRARVDMNGRADDLRQNNKAVTPTYPQRRSRSVMVFRRPS
ncbi:hypothetical protein B0I35DRAFT_249605 [Stachybotrys elegans]|uniref:Uncharacterized protein n=1 Tax=Stachybotrys elegans TaxID=80388 RepID=A0A8K0SML2_9HYPO|nr:hypothetical protein B0I35DRAFT_249605 [Stachybotrys elegans]